MKTNNKYEKIIGDLVAIPSTADNPDALSQAIDYCEDYFSDIPHLIIKRLSSGGKSSLIVQTRDEVFPKVAMIGHLDVVPATSDLYAIRKKGTLLYGRGVFDMKGSVAIMMRVLRSVVSHTAPVSAALWLTTDEEMGGYHGVRYLVDELGFRPKVALVPDGGNAPETIVLKSKGVLPLHMVARGISAHAARPWEGTSAIEKLIAAYQALHDVFRESVYNEDPDHWYSTCVMGLISGGEGFNMVPRYAECSIDIRLAEDLDIKVIKSKLDDVRKAYEVEIDILDESPVSVLGKHNPYVKLYQDILLRETNKDASFILYPGTNDGRFLSRKNIPVIISRPRGGGQHSKDEWVDLNSVEKLYDIYRDFLIGAQKIDNQD